MDIEEMGVLVRFLKGAESSILWALLLGKRPMTAVSLQEATGYSDKPVREALRRMEAVGLVRHYGRAAGWAASGEDWAGIVRQLQEGEADEAAEHNLSTGAEVEETAVGESSVESGESPVEGMGSEPAAACGLGSLDLGVRNNSGFIGESAVASGESATGGTGGSGFGVRNKSDIIGESSVASGESSAGRGESAAALAHGRGLDLTTAANCNTYSGDKSSKQKTRACAREGVPEKRGPPGVIVDGEWAWLWTAVSSLFTANAGIGPTLAQDSKVLFRTDHKKLAVTALGIDATAWRSARVECFSHAEINSGKKLGVFPKLLLVPNDLHDTALNITGYAEGMSTEYKPEVQARKTADPLPIVVIVPDWNDANHVCASARRWRSPCS